MRTLAPILIMLLAALAACDSGSSGGNDRAETCSGKSGVPGHHKVVTTSGGLERTYYVTVPQNYYPTRPTPVVFNIHGLTSNAGQQEMMSAMPEKAELEGFISVAPEGTQTPQSWNGSGCCAPALTEEIDDVGFFNQMIDELQAEYCVDARRVYSTGMSNGGFMSNKLACELSDRIAAIVPVVSVLDQEVCTPARPVPVLMFNGTLDPLVSYEGRMFVGVQSAYTRWLSINACDGAPSVSFQQDDVTCLTHDGCADNATTTLCTVEGGGHTWPGSEAFAPILEAVGMGHTTFAIDATDTMWDFFVQHPMPE